ncbi:hypothetical protein GUY44_07450 [Pimelobacter simplex]|uniref:Phage portal protein n=1 Tax=Nocardioides simplex TaxID=2045 RepID=A0A0A1DKD2_NOCSI|nr:hypothetical protein [Pimelobacter simplex]AIY15835.1 Phage portal protein [Pimelobacter simplex]MCG8150309.1 hypothetical protein [Pimelobacter simplex]GEB16674.1 hypothetical protein NSI01_49890 [Pimelobacter simplex]SFM90187.1 hypothetical protein SAMN05421671_4109 [Pimelobacter simplex]
MPTIMQWTKHLLEKIDKQKAYSAGFQRRYANEHILPFLAREYAEVYPGLIVASAGGTETALVTGNMFSALDVPKTGTAAVVVDALTERLLVGGLDAVDDKETSKILQNAWEGSDLDVMHQEGHREALIDSRAFASASREKNGDRAVVGIESATQAAVHRSQAPPYDVDAYLKIWTDEWTGDRRGMLRLDGIDQPLREDSVVHDDPQGSGVASRWIPDGDPISTGIKGVPVVEFAPRARLLLEPTSEIDRIATAVDVIDLIEGLMVFAGHFGAVPIRYGKGLDIPRDPKDPSKPLVGPDGKPVLGFKPRADHFWGTTSKDAEFGQLEPAGLASFVTWADHAAGVIRRQTKLPSGYFSLDLKSHMTGELLKVDEAPMVRRINGMGRMGSLNQSWRRLGQIILAIEVPSARVRVAPRWVDPETRIESQQVDQATKLIASGYDMRVVAERVLRWDPDVIDAAVGAAESGANADVFALLDPATRARLKAIPSADSDPAASA